MGNVNIPSTLQNKVGQKKSIHNSSSTVFFAVYNQEAGIDTEITLLNHFLLKRGITDVIATIEIRNEDGTLLKSLQLSMDERRSYSIRLGDYLDSTFIGSIYAFFQSNENLAVPFCAVMCSIKSIDSVCGVHTYGRRLEHNELGSQLDNKNTIETGWTARDTSTVNSFAVLHGGAFKVDLKVKLEITNNHNEVILLQKNFQLEPFGTLVIITQELSKDIVSHLNGKKGHIKVYIDGLNGIFPRMLCGNYKNTTNEFNRPTHAQEIQFTHTNFDFSTIKQPDAGGNIGYINQPSLPEGYGIVYPVDTHKSITIGGESYKSNSMHRISIKEMSQVEIKAKNENLPSRFVAAAVGKWDGASIESECSTGTFIEDYLKVSCHWHWGLLKPGFENGESIISLILNKFDRKEDLSRTIKFQLFDENKLLFEKKISIDDNKKISTKEIFSKEKPTGSVWYVFSGDCLEDLNIFSTFYPVNKAGFVEHAF